jgi:pyruvate dehydrogenase E2 component (dihydrolipoamide acetyltransferase)
MAIVIDMPKLSDTMQEGVIAKWNVKEGDTVKAGDIIAEVETDKATMDVEVFDAGTILKLMAKEGDAVALGAIMAIIGKPGEDISDLIGGDAKPKEDAKADKEKSADKKEEAPDKAGKKESDDTFDPILDDIEPKSGKDSSKESTKESSSEADGRIKASPLARKMAEEQGIDLGKIKGSGPDGRIVRKDIESAPAADSKETKAPAKSAPAVVIPEITTEDQDIRISQMRKTIARRLAESKFTSPHFYETIDIDMKQAVAAREQLNAISDVKLSFNDLIVKACAVALRRHPKVNTSWLGDTIRINGSVNIAIAVAVEDGLLTPVIRNTDLKGLRQISMETKELARKARDKKLQPEEWEGSTFTISNLGMFGIEEFTAIINPPNAAILAVGAIRDVPVVEDGKVVPGKRMKVTMSSDHRVVDGATVAEFLSTLRKLIENPSSMLL